MDFGYADEQVGVDEYSIVVRGNRRTDLARTNAIARLRAARLAREKGFAYFAILHEKHDRFSHVRGQFVVVYGLPPIPVGSVEERTPVSILIIKLLSDPGADLPNIVGVDEAEKEAKQKLGDD